jgi:catechol 2,3-dioxygenase-like lactoylglutathione lyase family enzyme
LEAAALEIKSVNHVGLSVSNLERSIEFYGALGFELDSRTEAFGHDEAEGTGVPDAHLYIAYMTQPGMRLELIQYTAIQSRTPPRNNDVGSAHFCFEVSDIAAAYEQMTKKGVSFVSPPHRYGDIKWVYFTDPDGITMELLEVLAESE